MWTVDLSKFSKFGDLDKEEFKFSPKDLDEFRKMPPWFYGPFGSALSPDFKRIAQEVCPAVVGVSCRFAFRPLRCSGFIVDWDGSPIILTSAYVLGEHAGDNNSSFTVDVYLHGGKTVTGNVEFVDQHFNFAIIKADIDEYKTLKLSAKMIEVGKPVLSVGRYCSDYKLVSSEGMTTTRKDHLESDDLLSSSCTITECGIGGPVLDSSGVLGMNFYSSQRTPFLPSNLLLKCLRHIKDHGKVLRPCLGLKCNSLDEVTLAELEMVYAKFEPLSKLIVREVCKGSPADEAGICVGDVITHCDDIPVSLPFQFTEVLCWLAELRMASQTESRETFCLKVTIQHLNTGEEEVRTMYFDSFSPLDINRWPVRPPVRPM